MGAAYHSTNRPSFWAALTGASLMGALFFLIYGGVNHFTELRTTVPSLFFGWELNIPFIPWMIVPYMSLDLFFLGAFFLCTSWRTLLLLAARIGFCIALSAVCFLIFPLQFDFPRPHTDGFPGLLFALLGLDLPYNQCPSLHISLTLVIGSVYVSKARDWLRTALNIWFLLIAVSTLFVYQHHAIDLAGGALVGLLAFYVIPAGSPHARLAARYAGLGLAFILAAMASGGWGWTLLYPALSCVLVALAYAANNNRFLSKSAGRYPWISLLLFTPYLAGVWLNWRYYKSRDKAWQEIAPRVLLGRRVNDPEARDLIKQGVVAVLDLAPELPSPRSFQQLDYCHLPVLDLTPLQSRQVDEALEFIGIHTRRGKVYIHCALGYARSVAVVLAYLCAQGKSLSEALSQVQQLRPNSTLSSLEV